MFMLFLIKKLFFEEKKVPAATRMAKENLYLPTFGDHLGVILGSSWGQVGDNLWSLWWHFVITLVTFWDHVGVIFVWFLDNCWVILESILDYVWVMLGSLWGHFRTSFGQTWHFRKMFGNGLGVFFQTFSVINSHI